jgi:DNA-binding response OmpR family regulator
MMFDQVETTVLGVALDDVPEQVGSAAFTSARSARQAIEMLRLLRFDLVVVGLRTPDMSAWQFVQRMRAGWPGQKWALVAGTLRTSEELNARTLGALVIFDEPADWSAIGEMARSLAERAAALREPPPVEVSFGPALRKRNAPLRPTGTGF